MVNIDTLDSAWKYAISGKRIKDETGEYHHIFKNGEIANGWNSEGILLSLVEEEDSQTASDLLSIIVDTQLKLTDAFHSVTEKLSLKEKLSEKERFMNNLYVKHYLDAELRTCDESIDNLLGVGEFAKQLENTIHSKEIREKLNAIRSRTIEYQREIQEMKQEDAELDKMMEKLEDAARLLGSSSIRPTSKHYNYSKK